MSLHLRLNLRFDKDIVFGEFLPESEDDRLHISLREGKYKVTLHLSDRETQLSILNDLPKAADKLQKYMTLYCSGLTMDIEVAEVDSDVLHAVEAGQPTEETAQFGREVFNIALEVHNKLISYFRSLAKQYWLEPLVPGPHNYQDFLMDKWRLRWLDSNGEWQPFPIPPERTIELTSRIRERGVDRDRWREMAPFIERGSRAPIRHMLIANSLQHLDQRNGRVAVTEAVTALESAMKQLLPEIVLGLPGDPQFKKEELVTLLDRIMKDGGFKLATKVGLGVIKAWAGLEDEDIRLAVKAIEVRNQVLHGGQREVKVPLANKCVTAIRRIIEALESWEAL